jgi:glycosyltransferase involved in cell wall biosynthesis
VDPGVRRDDGLWLLHMRVTSHKTYGSLGLMARDFSKIGIGWQIGAPTGWGTYGVNLALELARQGIEPVLFLVAPRLRLMPHQTEALRPLTNKTEEWHQTALRGGLVMDFPMLHPLGGGFEFYDVLNGARGTPNVGVPFFESAVIAPEHIAAAKNFDLIVAGSTWNAEILQRHGLEVPVAVCPQGVDLTLFKPAPKTGQFKDRFVIFSGGKLEYRKGQDLVVAAFKRFQARHSDAVLVTAWHSLWPELTKNLAASPHINGPPPFKADGNVDVGAWLLANGIPDSAFHDIGLVANGQMPSLLADMDMAVFPNRCEGGTNLVAMECMACGVPTALSRNTGHLDLIRGDNCYSLDLQLPMGEITKRADLEGWGESIVDELVQKMEQAYTDRADAARRGAAAAAFMQGWGWPEQVRRLVKALEI